MLEYLIRGLNYLPSPYNSIGERRIGLWRRAIFLFDRTEKESGPFYLAGYEDYWCEGKSDDGKTPDIFGFSNDFFCVCDVSMSPQKGEEMAKYANSSPNAYVRALFPAEKERKNAGNPFLITDEVGVEKYPGYNIVQVYQPGEAIIEEIVDQKLKEELDSWHGFTTPPPSYSILAVPESSPEELKSPVAGLLKWAAMQDAWVTSNQIIEKLLGDLLTSISGAGKAKIRSTVEKMLYDLHRGILKDYLDYDAGENAFKVKLDPSTNKGIKAFSNKINTWLKISPIERFYPLAAIDNDTAE